MLAAFADLPLPRTCAQPRGDSHSCDPQDHELLLEVFSGLPPAGPSKWLTLDRHPVAEPLPRRAIGHRQPEECRRLCIALEQLEVPAALLQKDLVLQCAVGTVNKRSSCRTMQSLCVRWDEEVRLLVRKKAEHLTLQVLELFQGWERCAHHLSWGCLSSSATHAIWGFCLARQGSGEAGREEVGGGVGVGAEHVSTAGQGGGDGGREGGGEGVEGCQRVGTGHPRLCVCVCVCVCGVASPALSCRRRGGHQSRPVPCSFFLWKCMRVDQALLLYP